jgi:uncharacterized protein
MSNQPPQVTANELLTKLVNQTTSFLMSRTRALEAKLLDRTNRDINEECGYPGLPLPNEFLRQMYDEIGIAARIVKVHPEESWFTYPELYEREDDRVTKFERRWNDLLVQHNIWTECQRADEQSRIMHYGVILIGVKDGADNLALPVPGITETGELDPNYKQEGLRDLLYLNSFPEDLTRIDEVEQRVNHPRYGQPKLYTIKLSSPQSWEGSSSQLTGSVTLADQKVHWTRVVHVADNTASSKIFGVPILQNVTPYVLDTRKILGSSGEMFYKGGFPGISFETDPALIADANLDMESLKKEIEAYSMGLQRYLRLVGMTAKSLAPQVSDPTNHLMGNINMICATIGVPVPVFLGQQLGHLASQQNSVDWNKRLKKRQNYYITPSIINRLVKRFILLRILPEADNWYVDWADLNTVSDTDRAKIALQRSQAVLQYVTSGSATVIPPRYFLTLVLGFTDKETDAVIEMAGGEEKLMKDLKGMVDPTAGNTPASTGTNPAAKTGAAGRTNGL